MSFLQNEEGYRDGKSIENEQAVAYPISYTANIVCVLKFHLFFDEVE